MDRVTKLFDAAFDLWDPRRPLETSQEQWLLADDTENLWTKKGNLTFADTKRGVALFGEHVGPVAGGAPAVVVASVVEQFDMGNDTVELVVYYTQERLDHFVNRHTYRHFDFNDIKPLNVFWGTGTTRPLLAATVTARLTDIKDEMVADAGVAGVDDTEVFDSRINVTIRKPGFKQSIADGTVYYAAVEAKVPPPALIVGDSNVEDYDPNADPDAPQTTRRDVSVEMFAPTGPTFSAYDSGTMDEIYDAL